jgi:cellulose synthase/poly-beta-1,6-N-acetylglucosamine synthase-like glycosyltransferase
VTRRKYDRSIGENVDHNKSVSVVIPAHHEGEGLVQTVESVLAQDYKGPIDITIILADEKDSSFAPLKSRFQFKWNKSSKETILIQENNRIARLVCCNRSPKKDKLNTYISKTTGDYVAFLDADHRADVDWITSALQTIDGTSYVGVQCRRAPLSLRKLPQLWDSAQNHIGNELVNSALDRLVGTVYFTGTTALFKGDAIRTRTFKDCVTEDTYYSYELLSEGERLAFCGTSGSREEVAPDLFSYIARRRRWSAGHNKTFFDLGRKVLKSDVDTSTKVATLLHGLFYSVPVVVCLLLNLYSLHMFVQLTPNLQLAATLISIACSLILTLLVFGRHKNVMREVFVLFLWFFPQVTLLTPLVMYWLDHELFFFLTTFPYARYLFYSHIFCLLAPVTLLIIGSFRVRVLQAYQLVMVVFSYPIFFFLDLWSCLLGFSDFLLGRPTWAKIQRTNQDDLSDGIEKRSSTRVLGRWGASLALIALTVVSVNDLTAHANCGKAKTMLFEPLLFIPESEIDWNLEHEHEVLDDSRVAFTFRSSFDALEASTVETRHFLDGVLSQSSENSTTETSEFRFESPMGWQGHSYRAVVKAGSSVCSREIPFTTTIKKTEGMKFFVNGEEFFIKGVIPSFSPASKFVNLEKAFRQIKALGANTLRYYHEVRDKTLQAAIKKELLLLDQPDYSTWDDSNLEFSLSRYRLQKRFGNLVKNNGDNPYSLFHTLGNELEILDPEDRVPELVNLMNQIKKNDPKLLFSYSTYFVYLDLPAPINGVNMLDSGETYWQGGLETLQSIGKPFFASEFGGFVAFYERTPPELRVHRFISYWQRLLDAGAFGIVFHQSHDNLAQPVIHGFNDPLSADQPDDLRGIWDVENKPKLEMRFVEHLFSDFEAHIEDEILTNGQKEFTIRLKNRRPYRLIDVLISNAGRPLSSRLHFEPHEAKSLTLPMDSISNAWLKLDARYSTHQGLLASSVVRLRPPIQGEQVQVLNFDAVDLKSSKEKTTGRLLYSASLDIVAPSSWKEAVINGSLTKLTPGRNTIEMRPAMEDAVDFELSRDDKSWFPLIPEEVGKGPYRLRFKLKRRYPKDAKLLLPGLGSHKFWIKYGSDADWQELPSHPYRENIVPLDNFNADSEDYFYLLVPRKQTVFIHEKYHPEGKTIPILIETPRVFSPAEFSITKVNQ